MKPGVRKPARFIRDLLRASPFNRSRIAAVAPWVILLAGSPYARADETRERLTLEYKASATCPGAERFVSEVAELTDKAKFESPSDLPVDRELSVTITERSSGFLGTMRLKDVTGTSHREIEGESCEEVVGALALALALAVDPDALGGGEPTAGDPEPVVLEDSPPENPAENEPKNEEVSTTEPPSDSREGTTHLIVGAGFQYGFWFVRTQDDSGELVRGSHARLQGRVSLELETKALGFWTSYGLDMGGAWASTEPLSFRWLPIVRASVCPLWIRGTEWLRFGMCVGGIFSPLYTPPADFEQAQSVTSNYAGIDTVLRLQFVAGAFRAEFQGGVELPLVTQPYGTASTNAPDDIVFVMDHTPTPTLGLAVGWQIF